MGLGQDALQWGVDAQLWGIPFVTILDFFEWGLTVWLMLELAV